jgi:hypothetical protein
MNVDTQRRRVLSLAGTAALTGLSGCSGATPFVGKRLEDEQTYDAGTVDAVAVDGRNGSLTVRPTDGERVRVKTVKKAGSVFADLDDVRVETTTEAGELRIASRKTGEGSWLAGVPSVDVTVELPSGVDLGELRTENGSIDVRGVESDATLATENGSVEVRNVDGFVAAESENGSVSIRDVTGIDGVQTENGSVDVDVPAIRGDTTIQTENGGVSAAVSPDVDAQVVATTERGGMRVDLPNFEATTETDRRVEGTLGDGGPQLRFETENGGLEVTEL